MAEESFYNVTLSSENKQAEWDELSSDKDFPQGQRLIIKQILLGAEAKEGEFNVVEAHIKDGFRIPIAVLKAGETRALNPDLEFFEVSVTFKLIKGNGPVYILGQNFKKEVDDALGDMDDEDDGDEEEEPEQFAGKKIKAENNFSHAKNAKSKKM